MKKIVYTYICLGLMLLPNIPLAERHEFSEEAKKTLKKWQSEQNENLRKPDGWLSLVALHWLSDGKNSIRLDKRGRFVAKPVQAGSKSRGLDFTVEMGKVFLEVPEVGAPVKVNGEFPRQRMELAPDTSNNKTTVEFGRLKIHLADRSGKLGLRVSDPESPNLKNYTGRKWFRFNEEFLIPAKFVAFKEPKTMEHMNQIGQTLSTLSPGELVFTRAGKEYRLLTIGDPKKYLFLIFRDDSSGRTTYGAGRYLTVSTKQDSNGNYVIDFNRSTNPPCAFTNFATCPLPPKENWLDFSVVAGEKADNNG